MKRVIEKIEHLLKTRQQVVVAIDGPCGAGKSTFGEALQRELNANLFRMDDFFLPLAEKTKERLDAPGGNVDWERFLNEVLLPLKNGMPFSYRPFDCKAQVLADPVAVTPLAIAVVEGSYSHHPGLAEHYDVKVFLDISKYTQQRRILKRSGAEMLPRFMNEWIPLENAYFEAFQIAAHSDIIIINESI